MLAFIVLFPIYITVVNSLLRPEQITKQPPTLFPTNPQWHNYPDAWNDAHMARVPEEQLHRDRDHHDLVR